MAFGTSSSSSNIAGRVALVFSTEHQFKFSFIGSPLREVIIDEERPCGDLVLPFQWLDLLQMGGRDVFE
jgi:hypothetical protein